MKIRVCHSDEKLWWKCSYADFARVSDPLTCSPSKGVLERCFLKSGLITFFTLCNFRNKVAMRIIFFFKMFKIWFRFQKWNKKIRKFVGFIDKIIWIGDEKCTKSRTEYLSLAVNMLRNKPKMKKMLKGLLCRFHKTLGHFNMLIVKVVSGTVFFKEWSNQVFHSL